MTIIQIDEHHELNEITNFLEFHFLTPTPDGYKSVIQPVYCKDYFQDLIWAFHNKKNIEDLYKLNYKYKEEDNCLNSDYFHILTVIRKGSLCESAFKRNSVNYLLLKDVLHSMEKAMGFKNLSRIIPWHNYIGNWQSNFRLIDKDGAKKDEEINPLLFNFSTEWLKYPWLLSFLLEITRNLFLIRSKDVVTYLDNLANFTAVLTAFDMQFNNITVCKTMYQNILAKGLVEVDFNEDTDDADEDENYIESSNLLSWSAKHCTDHFHNRSGFASNFKYINESYDRLTTSIDRV